MNRIIKFRGLRTDGKGWVYGHLIHDHEKRYIVTKDSPIWVNYIPKEDESHHHQIKVVIYKVHPESVGQFTGLKDVNGVEIYEGDILCNCKYQTWEWRGVVKFSHGIFGAEWLSNVKNQSMVGSWGQKHNLRKLDDEIIERQIVIGNIYENPELLNQLS